MIYRYIRYSTDSQDADSQMAIIDNYCQNKGILIGQTLIDSAISGASDLSKRELSTLLNKLKEGDTLLISELSRLTRKGTIELNEIIKNYFKPAKVRLIICNYGLDIDCNNIDAMTELMLNMMGTFARIERDSIISRTKGGIKAAHARGSKSGGASPSYGKGENYKQNKAEGLQTRSANNIHKRLQSVELSIIIKAVESVLPEIIDNRIEGIEYPFLGYCSFRKITQNEWEQICRRIKEFQSISSDTLIDKSTFDVEYIKKNYNYIWQSRFRSTAEKYVKYQK